LRTTSPVAAPRWPRSNEHICHAPFLIHRSHAGQSRPHGPGRMRPGRMRKDSHQGPAPPNPVNGRHVTLSGCAGTATGQGTASPSAPRPGPCTRPRTGRCRGQPADPAALGTVSRALRGPSDRPSAALDPPPAPRAVVHTPPGAGEGTPAGRDQNPDAAGIFRRNRYSSRVVAPALTWQARKESAALDPPGERQQAAHAC